MKSLLVTVFLLGMAGFSAFSQTLTLEKAIRTSAKEMGTRLDKGSTIAVLNFTTTSERMAAHVIDELNNVLVNDRQLTVVDRRRRDLVDKEFDFSDSGYVSDESAQQIGRALGAGFIVSGSLELMGADYRFRVQVLEVESITMRYSYSVNIHDNQQVKALMSETGIVDYTMPERTGAAALNLVFGAGSFVQKDWLGGGITAGAEAIGTVFFLYGLLSHIGWRHEWSIVECSDYAYPFFIGIGAYAGGAIFGIVRAFIFHKPGSVSAEAAADSPFNLTLVPDSKGNAAVRMSYTLRF
jgi:TolB-like protein